MGGSGSPHLSCLLLTMKLNYENLSKSTKLSRAQYLTCPEFAFSVHAHHNLLTKIFSKNPGKLVLEVSGIDETDS